MRVVTPLLRSVVYPALASAGVFHRTRRSGVAIVTYHGVLPLGYTPADAAFDGNLISADVLRRQLRLLKTNYSVISPEEFLHLGESRDKLPSRSVLLTCDDGLLNCLTDMLPILQEENLKCLFFVTGASAMDSRSMLWYEELFLLFVEAVAGPFAFSCDGITIQGTLGSREQRRALWWDSLKHLSQVDAKRRLVFIQSLRDHFGLDDLISTDPDGASCRRYGLLTASEVLQLVSSGMSIGAHTLSHPMLSQQPLELAYDEITESRTRLEAALKVRVWAFAYPFGNPQSVTSQVLAMPRQAGYQAAFLNFGGGLGSALPTYSLPRIHVTRGMSMSEFEAHVSGFYMRLQNLARHAVAAEGD